MSMRRARIKGEVPEEIYVVSFGTSHKIYSRLGSARGIITQWNKYKFPPALDGYPKIYRLCSGTDITAGDWEEVE